MPKASLLVLLAVLLVAPGCYHATVVTGKTPSATVVEQPFALGFVYGIIPPPTLKVAEDCPYGVAKVETQQTVVNGLVSVLTGGLITPWNIKVTCAAAGSASAVPADGAEVTVADTAETADVQAAFSEAADAAVETGDPVYVRFQ
ncbi:MAG: hypothetical protein AAF791_03395 [Bacteroidota bacterium]